MIIIMVVFKWKKKRLHKILFSTIFLFGFFIKRRLLYTFFHMFMKKENKIKWLASAHYHDQIEFYFVNKLGRLNIITKFIASTKKFQAILNYFHSHQIQKFTLYCKPVSECIEKEHERKKIIIIIHKPTRRWSGETKKSPIAILYLWKNHFLKNH